MNRFFILKKVFTLSHEGFFFLIIRRFKCEGLRFQVFTAIRAIYTAFLLITNVFPV